MPRRANSTSFKPGQIANPGGRPKAVAEVRALAREHSVEAMETLVQVMRNPSSPTNARIAAADAILNRGYGRPETTVNVRRITSIADLSDEELATLAAEAEHAGGTQH